MRTTSLAFWAVMVCWNAWAYEPVVSSYWGDSKQDALRGVVVLPDRSIVAGGIADAESISGLDLKLQGGQGRLALLTSDGKKISDEPLPVAVSDLDCDSLGRVLAVGRGGAVCWDTKHRAVVWQADVGDENSRISAGPDRGAVILTGRKISIIDSNGGVVRAFDVAGGYVSDLACDVRTGTVFIAGFDNKRGTPPKQKNYPVQVAFVRAYSVEGGQLWQAYGWAGQEVADRQLMADTRAYRLALSRDGKLYVAGESAGGNTIWLRSSKNLDQPLAIAKHDAFQHAYNTAANHITAVVRLDAKTGDSEAATLLLARLPNGKGNTIRPRAIAVDGAGTVYVGGASASNPPKSDGSFGRDGGGAFLTAFDAGFQRVFATTLAGSGSLQALAAGEGIVAAVGLVEENDLATFKAFKQSVAGQSDGFIVVLRNANTPR